MFHRQLPLPMPCYDFTLVTDLTVNPLINRRDFGYYRLHWCDGRLSSRNLELMFPLYVRISRIQRVLMHLCIRKSPSSCEYYDLADFSYRISFLNRYEISLGQVYFCSRHPIEGLHCIFPTLTCPSVGRYTLNQLAAFCLRILRLLPRANRLSFGYKEWI